MKRILMAVVLCASLAGCIDEGQAREALEAAGYTEIVMSGYVFLGCDSRDVNRFGFTAKGVNGRPIAGVVCASFFKGSTIRTWAP